MINTKFTEEEMDLIQEMIDFPEVYRLRPKAIKAVKSILKKMETVNTKD